MLLLIGATPFKAITWSCKTDFLVTNTPSSVKIFLKNLRSTVCMSTGNLLVFLLYCLVFQYITAQGTISAGYATVRTVSVCQYLFFTDTMLGGSKGREEEEKQEAGGQHTQRAL